MGILFIIGFIAFWVIAIFISIKVSELKNRASQHILKNSGFSSSEINAGISDSFEKKHLQNFLAEHSNYTEETIKDLLKQYTVQIFNKQQINEFSQKVYEKMQSDKKIDKIREMEFKRTNIYYYGNSKLNAVVIYADSRDEYEIHLYCSVLGDRIQVDRYQIAKGQAIGF